MGKSRHEIQDDINYAACDLRKSEERMAELHQAAADAVVVAAMEKADERWSLKDDETVNLQVNISAKLFKNLLEVQGDIDIDRERVRALKLQMAETLEREAAEIRRQIGA